jgi:hypothetical protein
MKFRLTTTDPEGNRVTIRNYNSASWSSARDYAKWFVALGIPVSREGTFIINGKLYSIEKPSK